MSFFKDYSNSLSVGKQIGALLLFFFIVIFYTCYLIYIEKQIAIDFGSKEALGNRYIIGSQKIYADLIDIKTEKSRSISEDSIKSLVEAETLYGQDKKMETQEAFTILKNKAERVNENRSSNVQAQKDIADEAISALLKLINIIGDKSNLILDPDLDSYYIMDLILLKLPNIIAKNLELKETIQKNLSKILSFQDKASLLIIKGEVNSLAEGITNSYSAMLKGSPDDVSRQNLEESYTIVRGAVDDFFKQVDGILFLSTLPSDADLKNLETAYQKVNLHYFEFWKKSCEELDRLLLKRTNGFYTKMTHNFLIVLLMVLICILGSYYIYRSITIPIHHFISTLRKVQDNDDYTLRIQFENVLGEFSILGNSFNNMLQKIDTNRNEDIFNKASEEEAIQEISNLIQEISIGNITQRIKLDEKTGFIYNVGIGLNRLIDNIESFLKDVSIVMFGISRCDLTEMIRSDYKGDFNKLKTDVNSAILSIAEVVKLLTNTTNQVAVTSSETSLAISQISDGAQTQITSINDVVQQVSLTTEANEEISKNTESASAMARESVKIALNGKDKMKTMISIVNNIAENSAKINKITETIEKIANKTNLLSLNAAIEAARAGEHGKGFAVVADEVGKLASSAADSTQEISLLIQEASTEANKAVESVSLISQDMEQIQLFIQENDEILKKISNSIDGQNNSLKRIQENMKELQGVANNNAAASEEITSTAIDLAKISDIARKELNKFRV